MITWTWSILLLALIPISVTAESKDLKSLEELKNLKGTVQTDSAREHEIRLNLLTEQAEELGCVHGYITTMNILVEAAEATSDLWQRLIPFESIVNAAANLSSGEAKYIVPGVIDKIEDHATIQRTDEALIIRKDNVVFFMKSQPKPALRMPSWTDFFFEENKLSVSEPIVELLPSNEQEQEHYEQALSEGWAMCEEQAIMEMRSRVIRAFKTASGMTRYANLVESKQITKPMLVIENVGVSIDGDQMGLGTQYVSLDGNAAWQPNSDLYSSPVIENPRGSIRKEILSLIETGRLDIQDIEDSINYLDE